VDPGLVRGSLRSFEGELAFAGDRPLNPRGRTGISGRGELGCWGPNHAADPIVTRFNPQTGALEAILIERQDSGELAIPGGMRDRTDPHISATLARELGEETGARVDFSQGTIVYRGYVDDRRNTDHAWMETTVAHLHLTPDEALKITLAAGDDARPGSARWVPLTAEVIARMYASHGDFLRRAIGSLRS
jgi:ADP-ribose pyrophosphatase